jgi:hypothetical protein
VERIWICPTRTGSTSPRDWGARDVLRSTLWGQRRDSGKGPMERTVTWSSWSMEHYFVFTGGIIMIGNRPLGDLPEL